MKQQHNTYEVVILGSGLAGLVAGTLLSKKSHTVLFLKESGYQPSFVKKGYRFVPFSNFSEKLLNTAVLQEISQALSLPLTTSQWKGDRQTRIDSKKPKQEVAFQVILPSARIDLFFKRSLLRREWRREFPEEVSQIENFYNEMDHLQVLLNKLKTKENPQGFFPIWQCSLIRRLLKFKRLPKKKMEEGISSFSREFKEFIKLQLISKGNLYSDQIPIALAAHLLLNDGLNGLAPHVDLEKLEKNILEKYFQSGGRIEEIERVEELDTGRRKEFILSSAGNQMTFRSDCLILNLPLHRLSNFLHKKRNRLSKWEKKIQPQYVLIPLFLGISENVIPVGMKDLLVSILDLGRPYEGGNILFISLSPKGDETKAPVGRRALTIESLMPLEKWDQTPLVDYQKGVLEHLNYLFPFLEKHIEFMDWSWVNEQVPRWSYPHFLYETTSDFNWRKGVVPTRISRNLYFIGKENFPYLGLEGEVLSGLIVGRQILQKFSWKPHQFI
jgi:phytoene dehydrogenase-like protein